MWPLDWLNLTQIIMMWYTFIYLHSRYPSCCYPSQGPQGEKGPQGEEGDQGFSGPQGEAGFPGDVGRQGPQGVQGEPGDPGLPVSVICRTQLF